MKYKDIKSPNDLLMFMKENFLYGYTDKNGKKHYPEDKDFNLYWYDNYSLSSFDDVINNNDIYKEKRNEMKNLFNKYADDKSSERLAKYLKL